MLRMFQPYVEFLGRPGVGRLFMFAALSRMPIAMNALAVTLFLRFEMGNFTLAGLGIGSYFIAIAVVAPLLGRWIDRAGPRLPLLITGWLQPLALLSVFFAARAHMAAWIVLALIVVAGLLPPPLTILTRTLWRLLFKSDGDRRMAFALDSVITELNFTIGPAIVGVLVAYLSASAAFLIAIVCNWLAFLVFLRTPLLDQWQQDTHGERHWLGPLSDGTLVLYFALTFGLVSCFGMFEVGYPAYALAINAPGYAGLLVALNGLGSAVGGALFGVWQSRRSLEQQYALTLTFLVLPFVLHALLPQLWAFIPVAFIGGMAIAPAITSINLLTSRRAPARYATEAQTWTMTFVVSGVGGGMAAAGYLLETWSIPTMFWLGAAVVGSMALCAWLLQAVHKSHETMV
jgi:MFS family permease